MARITGKKLMFKIGTPATEWNGEIRSYAAEAADIDSPTFAEVMSGAAQWTINATVEQDMSTSSAFRYAWDNSGATGVTVKLIPNANTTASASEPHILFTCSLGRKPTIGGEATFDSRALTSDLEIFVDEGPSLITS